MQITVTQRMLTTDEARTIHLALRTTPNILGYTIGELKSQRQMFVATVEGEFAGICFNTDLLFGWTEIAVLYVLDHHQGKGIGKTLFDTAFAQCQERQRHIFILSRNPVVVHWMEQKGMIVEKANPAHAPLAFHLYSFWYMAHPYRNIESFRKLPQLLKTPPLMQGILRYYLATINSTKI
jgi:GNAT superfamily N-acetyltransferase